MYAPVGIPNDYVLKKNEEFRDGLIWRWCHPERNSCGHFISTREPLDQTCKDDNSEEWDGPKGFVTWSMESDPNWMTQEMMVRWMRHVPHCAGCIQHDNSYLFPAWYDISDEQMERLIKLYTENYPENLQQPWFSVVGDGLFTLRLPRTCCCDDCDDSCTDFDANTLKGNIVAICGIRAARDGNRVDRPFNIRNYPIDLSTPEGWKQMLEMFPQEKRVL